jgi:hypothetical protein
MTRGVLTAVRAAVKAGAMDVVEGVAIYALWVPGRDSRRGRRSHDSAIHLWGCPCGSGVLAAISPGNPPARRG